MTLTTYGLALLIVAGAAAVQASIGFGFGMLAAPLLALIDPSFIPGPVLVLGLATTALVAWRERGALDWRGIRWALVGRVLGTLGGVAMIHRLDRDQVAVVLSAVILGAVATSIAGWHLPPTAPTLLGAGALSGVMGTLTSIGGPPMALVYQRERAAVLRATLAGFFLFGASFALLSLAATGALSRHDVRNGLALLPGLALGLMLTRRIAPGLDRGWTRPAVLALCSAAAIALVVDVAA